MSSLGYLWVYRFLAQSPIALGERFFAQSSRGQPPSPGRPRSLESGRELADFDLIAASLVLENDYWLLPDILARAGLAPYRKDREGRGPLVLVGGVGVWANPWPIMPFVDLVLLGEGENQWPVIVKAFGEKDFLDLGYAASLNRLTRIVPGALAPGLWPAEGKTGEDKPGEDKPGFGAAGYPVPLPGKGVRPSILKWPFDGDLLPPSTPILTPETEFPLTTLVEISRGCPWGCRFCLAGHLYRPHRTWSFDSVIKAAHSLVDSGGRVGLVSPAVADHPELERILGALIERKTSVGVSSMRLSSLSEKLAGYLSQAGLNALAVAPEAGSQRLRDSINKNLTEPEILASARLLAGHGLKRLKLYFMIGLPGEGEEDLRDLARLAALVKKETRIGRGGPTISVSLSNFTPKPQTPFEDCPLLGEREMRERGRKISDWLAKIGGLEVRLDPPKGAILQGLLARGGPESHLLVMAQAQSGGKVGPALKAIGYGPDHPIHRSWEGPKPWRVVEPQTGETFLAQGAKMSREGQPLPPCPPELGCGRCLACQNALGSPQGTGGLIEL
jgi:radical SAM superfamily enzyme YgiQ (UPF0313 family)